MRFNSLPLALSASLVLGAGGLASQVFAGESRDKEVPSLCTADESVIFACTTRQKKSASLCAAKKLSKDEGYLIYRFGRVDSLGKKTELVYPEAGVRPDKAFTYSTYTYAKGHGVQATFDVGPYTYTLYDDDHAYGASGPGVIVQKGGKQVSYFECQGRATIQLESLANIGLPEAKDPVWPKHDGANSNTPP